MFKVLSETFNRDQTGEVAANPVHLLLALRDTIINQEFDKEKEDIYIDTILAKITEKYKDYIGDEINKAYVDSYSSYGQNMFDHYIDYAIHWLDDKDYRDPDTGTAYDRDALHDELVKIERPGKIANYSDFRNDVVRFALMYRSKNDGENPKWNAYSPFKKIIEKELFSKTENLLPVISFTSKRSEEDQTKHEGFVKRMIEKGYTERQIRIIVDWYMMMKKNS